MKRFTITESERNNILRKHGILLKEELSAADMLAAIQTAINTNPDKKIGPDTTSKLVSALGGLPKTTGDFSCVKNNKNMQRKVEYDDNENPIFKGFQIGDLVFDKSGNYYNVKDETKKYTYKCNGTVIETSNDGKIEGEVKKDNTNVIKNDIKRMRAMDEVSDEEIITTLMKTYKKDEIMNAVKGDTKMEEILNKQPDTKPEVKPENPKAEVKSTGTERVDDETSIFKS